MLQMTTELNRMRNMAGAGKRIFTSVMASQRAQTGYSQVITLKASTKAVFRRLSLRKPSSLLETRRD